MFAIVYDSTTKKIKRVQAGVLSENDVSIGEGESFMLKSVVPPAIGKSDSLDEDGNIVPYIPPPPTEEELMKRKIRQTEWAIQAWLDDEARAHGYDSILSACSYAAYDNPFQAEGQAFVKWRGAVWRYCYDQLAAIENGEREPPESVAAFLAELPAYEPPSA